MYLRERKREQENKRIAMLTEQMCTSACCSWRLAPSSDAVRLPLLLMNNEANLCATVENNS